MELKLTIKVDCEELTETLDDIARQIQDNEEHIHRWHWIHDKRGNVIGNWIVE